MRLKKDTIPFGIMAASVIALMLMPLSAEAQMFSVKNENRRSVVPRAGLYIGLEPSNFEYTGPDNPSLPRYDFKAPILRIRMETPALQLYTGYGAGFTGLDNISYFNIGARLGRPFPIVRNRRAMVLLPLELMTDYTLATNDRYTGDQFSQSSLALGLGLEGHFRLSKTFRLKLGVIPHYGYSLAMGGTFSGQLVDVSGQARIYIDDIFNGNGLSIGYDYGYRNYNVDVDRFDYRLNSHSFVVGITF